jgi:nucleoside phosphorylase
MEILLAHALRSEAGLIKQHFPLAKHISRENGRELIQMDTHVQLLRTGIGLESSASVIQANIDPDHVDLIIHFGVSGSLSSSLPLLQIIIGTRFSCSGKPDLTVEPPDLIPGENKIPAVPFYSSMHAITDETMRETARSTDAMAVDMESYSVALFCKKHDIPLLAIRCISDRAGDSTPEDFKTYYPKAAQTLQEFILKNILKNPQIVP